MELLEAPNHQLPDEPKARALALAALGHSYQSIAPLVGVSDVTVGRWVARSREVSGNKPILDKWLRRSSQALDLIEDGLDAIEKEGDAKKNLMVLNVIAGTGTDKLQKEAAPQNPGGVTVNFIFKDAPIIEGEVVG